MCLKLEEVVSAWVSGGLTEPVSLSSAGYMGGMGNYLGNLGTGGYGAGNTTTLQMSSLRL